MWKSETHQGAAANQDINEWSEKNQVSSEMTEFVLAQSLFTFYHPEVDGTDKYLWMDEMERLSNKMVNEIRCC